MENLPQQFIINQLWDLIALTLAIIMYIKNYWSNKNTNFRIDTKKLALTINNLFNTVFIISIGVFLLNNISLPMAESYGGWLDTWLPRSRFSVLILILFAPLHIGFIIIPFIIPHYLFKLLVILVDILASRLALTHLYYVDNKVEIHKFFLSIIYIAFVMILSSYFYKKLTYLWVRLF